jgi:hypothetical protein
VARAPKHGADWFHHQAHHGKTMFILEAKFGNDGYAFWFKLLEMLTAVTGHYLRVADAQEWEFLLAKTRVDGEKASVIHRQGVVGDRKGHLVAESGRLPGVGVPRPEGSGAVEARFNSRR